MIKNLIYILLGLYLFSCQKYDPVSGVPQVSGINYDSIFESPTIDISWEGNVYAAGYRYRLEPTSYFDTVKTYLNWSDWTADTSVTLEYIDEGFYNFYVQSRFNLDNMQIDSAQVSFEVNAMQESSLLIYPMWLTLNTTETDTLNIYLYAEELIPIYGSDVRLLYDAEILTFMKKTNVGIYSNLIIIPQEQDAEPGVLLLTMSNFSTEAEISGTGAIVRLTFSVTPQDFTITTSVDIDGDHEDTYLQNTSEEIILLLDGHWRNGLIQLVP